MDELLAFIQRIQATTLQDLQQGHNRDYLLRNATEELGEYAAAVTVQEGMKQKELKETPQQEAVDVFICAASLFFANQGNLDELIRYGNLKLNKWQDRLNKKN